jgi:hypothetical protein
LNERRGWEKRYDDIRTKLLLLSSGDKVVFPSRIFRTLNSKNLQFGKSGTIPSVKTAPNIDGKLNDATWNDSSLWRGQFTRVEDDDVKVPDTKLWLAHDTKFLYIAVRAQHQQRAAKIAVDIAPANADTRWRFITLSDGAQRIEKHTSEGHFLFESPDVKMARVTHTTRNSEYSIAEIKIPLSLLNNVRRFRFNVSRRVYFPQSEMFYTARAYLDADDVTRMPFVALTKNRRIDNGITR